MFNLPMNSTIANNTVFHEGNHDGRGLPHEQYISKWNLNTTTSNGEITNKYTKILEINYEEDNNMTCNYIIEIVNPRYLDKVIYLYIALGTSQSYKYEYNDHFSLWYKSTVISTTGGKNTNKVEVYAKLHKSYNPLFFRVHTAKNNEVWNYENNYAYNCITLFSNQPLLDSVNDIAQCSDVAPIRHFYKRQSWGQVTIPSGGKYQIVINDDNIKWDSVLSFTTSSEIPSELMYTVSVKNGGGSAIINIRNVSTVSANFPACQLILMITQAF